MVGTEFLNLLSIRDYLQEKWFKSCHLLFFKAGFILMSLGMSPLHTRKSRSSKLIYKQKGCINVKMFLMTTIYLLRAPKYLGGSSMKETNLKRKSMIASKSERLNERLILWRMFNPQTTIPVPRDEYVLSSPCSLGVPQECALCL